MRKHIRPATSPNTNENWRNLDEDIDVELTSEDPERPIENALLAHATSGWRAGEPGRQTITLTWPSPISISRIRVVFEEHSRARTQEFALRASGRNGERDIVRQQFTFSPPGTAIEREEYAVELDQVSQLELTIIPAIDGGDAVATLREWRIA